MGVLTRAVKAVIDEITKPETFVKGDEFESYVRNYLFPKNKYDLLQKTHDYSSNRNDFIDNTKEPDFKFRSIRIGKEFFVEAKFRSDFYRGAIEWCKPYQFKRYRDIDKKIPVYIVIGIGNSPQTPEHIFFAPLKNLKYSKLFPSTIKEFEIPVGQYIEENRLIT